MNRFSIWLLIFSGFCLATSVSYGQSAIRGQVLDKTTQQPVPFVSVALYRLPDSVAVGGSISDSTGRFQITATKPGTYQLRTFFVGYKPVQQTVTVAGREPLELGTLLIEADLRLLQEVRVKGQRAELTTKADRQSYRAEQFRAAAGGTATDVLRNLPGVTLNAEGEVSLRGTTGFLVLLNGKPVQANLGTLLSQLPANSIEAIEVITTPNARYDPDGKAGIIAIVTKRGADSGWSATANGLVGLPSFNTFDNARHPRRYSTDVALNYRSDKWDVVLSSAYIRNDVAGRRESDVSTTIGNRQTRFPSVGERSFDRYTFTNRVAVAYVPNAANAWNAGIYHSLRTEDRLADIFYDNTRTDRQTGQLLSRTAYFNNNLVRKNGQFLTTTLDYTHTFPTKAKLGGSLLYEYDFLDGFTSNRNLRGTDFRDTLQYTVTTTDRPIDNVRANLDGQLPMWGGTLEGGYQYRYQNDRGRYLYREQNGNGRPLLTYPEFSGLVRITNQIHSVYTQFSARRSKAEWSAGLRYEYAERQLVTPTGQSLWLRLNNVFPSVNVLLKPKDGLALKAGFSRRVQRNSNLALNPLPEREHSETLEQGDPNLLPEFVNLAEIGVTKSIGGGGTLLGTLYYQGIENIVNRVNRVYTDTILSRIYTNAGLAQRFGLELAADLKPTRNWKLYVGSNLYRYTLAGNLFQNAVSFNRVAWVYSVNANSTVQLAKTWSAQVGVNYLSERITAQGEDSRFLTPNASLRKTLLTDRLTVTLQWQNIGLGWLPTNEQRITTRGADFFTTTNYIQEKDIFLINLSYSLRQLSKRAKLPGTEFGDKEF